jgi:hypothetical protein
MIMAVGYRIEMMHRLSALETRRRVMDGYVDGLVIDLGHLFTMSERKLIAQHLISLGIPVEFTYTMRRTTRKNIPEMVIATTNLPLVLDLLKPYLLPDYVYLFEVDDIYQ